MLKYLKLLTISALLISIIQNCQVQQAGLQDNQRKIFLDVHNDYRNQIAQGQLGQPSASNMMILEWDNELEMHASNYANSCPGMVHNPNRNSQNYKNIGENLYLSSSSIQTDINPKKAIDSWFDEYKQFSENSINPFRFSMQTGHYTQIVWAKTSKIGCAFNVQQTGGMYESLIVCNYYIGGNIINSPMYMKGKPCSECQEGFQCNAKYLSLCSINQQNSINQPQIDSTQNSNAQQQDIQNNIPQMNQNTFNQPQIDSTQNSNAQQQDLQNNIPQMNQNTFNQPQIDSTQNSNAQQQDLQNNIPQMNQNTFNQSQIDSTQNSNAQQQDLQKNIPQMNQNTFNQPQIDKQQTQFNYGLIQEQQNKQIQSEFPQFTAQNEIITYENLNSDEQYKNANQQQFNVSNLQNQVNHNAQNSQSTIQLNQGFIQTQINSLIAKTNQNPLSQSNINSP